MRERRRNASRTIFALATALGLAHPAIAEGDAEKGWQGRYRYVFDGGKTVGGSGIVVTHDLAIGPAGARGGCLLSSGGFQTDGRIVCHLGGDRKTLSVQFHGYPDGRLVNKYGVALYKPGQTLFSLRKTEDGALHTTWEAFQPDRPKDAAHPGLFFERLP